MNFSNRPAPIEIISFFNTRYSAKALGTAMNDRVMNDTVRRMFLVMSLSFFFSPKKETEAKEVKKVI